jgi:hypothetical protein
MKLFFESFREDCIQYYNLSLNIFLLIINYFIKSDSGYRCRSEERRVGKECYLTYYEVGW